MACSGKLDIHRIGAWLRLDGFPAKVHFTQPEHERKMQAAPEELLAP